MSNCSANCTRRNLNEFKSKSRYSFLLRSNSCANVRQVRIGSPGWLSFGSNISLEGSTGAVCFLINFCLLSHFVYSIINSERWC